MAVGVMLLEIKNPAKMLMIKIHLVELVRGGLFSLITVKVENKVVLEVQRKWLGCCQQLLGCGSKGQQGPGVEGQQSQEAGLRSNSPWEA